MKVLVKLTLEVSKLVHKDTITYTEEAVTVLSQDKWEILEDPRYSPIFIALREGPLTVKDLTTKYNQIVKDQIDKMDLSRDKKRELKTELERKAVTLYKYIDKLKKEELIVEAGRRIKTGQTATETLFGRTAKLYLMTSVNKENEYKDNFDKSLPLLSKILSLIYKKPEPSVECLSRLFDKLFSFIHNERESIFTIHSQELAEIAKDSSYSELRNIINGLDYLLTILNAPEFEKELEECFKK